MCKRGVGGIHLSIWALSDSLSLSLVGLSLSYCWDTSDCQTNTTWAKEKAITLPHVSCRGNRGVVIPLRQPNRIMESVARLKKSLRSPMRRLTSCVAGPKEKRLCARPRGKKGRDKRRCNILGKTPPLKASKLKDPSMIRSYQADLEKQRQVDTVRNKEGSTYTFFEKYWYLWHYSHFLDNLWQQQTWWGCFTWSGSFW